MRGNVLYTAIFASLFLATAAWAENPSSKPTIEFELADQQGKIHSLGELQDRKAVVVAFLGTQCPLAKMYATRLQSIANEYADHGVAVVAVMPNSQDSWADIADFVRLHHLQYSVLKDQQNRVADLFGAERTPQVFLLDSNRSIRYSGRVDDQYLIGVARDKPTRADLRIALDELLRGGEITVAKTEPIGCVIGRSRPAQENSEVTYTNDIAPIFENRCVECHRAGQIGPFELSSYEEAAGWGEMIQEVVLSGRMPPWHADPKHGKFANDRRLPESEKKLIEKWVQAGCPEGDPSKMPERRKFTEGWQLKRQPDTVIAMEEEFTVPADAGPSGVPYQRFRVPTGFTEDKWIQASEIRPGNPAVVHHTIVYVEPPGATGRRGRIFLNAYVPGLRLDPLPERSAKRIPAGSTLLFEMHYTPNGSEQEDRTEIGLIFADVNEVDHEVVTAEVGNINFEIPPGAIEYAVTATSRPTKEPMTLLSMSPHMHLRGKAFRYELLTPNGQREVLLDVPAYDFNWQTRYVLAEPRELPEGSVIFCRAAFDNSEANLANPDPTKTVRWGDQSWEEMMLGFFDVVIPRDDDRKSAEKPVKTGLDFVGMFDTGDLDGDGGLSASEVAHHKLLSEHFNSIDVNGDGLLHVGEILNALRALGTPQ